MTEAPRPRMGRPRARKIVRTLATWLEAPSGEAIEWSTRGWTSRDWAVCRRLITIHGLAAHLFRTVGRLELARVLPADVHSWMTAQDARNAQRIDLLHGDLRAILKAAAAAGLTVMPLKGSLLTTVVAGDPHRRPMGDLDLLVRPPKRALMRTLLERLGYAYQPEANPRPTHDVYLRPGNTSVVSVDEHPDNPRRVEVHTEVMRHLWGWVNEDELTAALWAGATSGKVLGQPSQIPRLADLFAHVAIHASCDLLVGRGRLIQWIDLGVLATQVPSLDIARHERIAYPALRLASRALPRALPIGALTTMEEGMPVALVRWAATVPLDDRCGLMVDSADERPSALAERWRRWGPARWRLAVAYGNAPLPVAMMRHAGMLAGIWRRRFSDDGRGSTVR